MSSPGAQRQPCFHRFPLGRVNRKPCRCRAFQLGHSRLGSKPGTRLLRQFRQARIKGKATQAKSTRLEFALGPGVVVGRQSEGVDLRQIHGGDGNAERFEKGRRFEADVLATDLVTRVVFLFEHDDAPSGASALNGQRQPCQSAANDGNITLFGIHDGKMVMTCRKAHFHSMR